MINDERDPNVQDWFNRSVEELPPQPFTLAVLERVRRTERRLQLQRFMAMLVAFFSFCLLLPELVVPLNMLASLPLAVIDVGGKQWPMFVMMAIAILGWLVRYARNTGFLGRF